jgi:tol-pal system protein YbgF
MQAELRSLRNVVERQAFEIEQLKRDQRNQYLDLDSRLQALSGSAPVGPTPGSTPAPTVDSGAFETLPGAGAALGNADGPTAALPPIRDVPAPAPAPGADERAAYDRAFEALKQGRYEQSARLFAEFLRAYPAGEFADNATYWLGESHYVSEDYATALKTFESLLQNFPNSSKAADALLKVGYCQYQLGQTQQAVSTLNDVVARYPNTPVARLAQVRLRSLQLEQR